MILAKCPLRISLIGGGSDLPAFLETDIGKVITFTINKFVYVAVHDFFSGGIRISYSQQEQVLNSYMIKHPIFRETLLELNFNKSVEIGSFADVPSSGTGLGSSSSFTNALIVGLKTFLKQPFTKDQVARIACKIEIERCRHPIGYQDQWATAFGGLNLINFSESDVELRALPIVTTTKSIIDNSFRLFYLNKGRSANDILANIELNIRSSSKVKTAIKRSVELVPNMIQALEIADIDAIGLMLDEGWRLKQEYDNSVSTSEITDIYTKAKACGAIGGKIVGAGGGGFLLLCVPEKNSELFNSNFKGFRELYFSLETKGVEIVYNDGKVKNV